MANTFVNKKKDLTSTSATTLYTVPTATTAVVKSILVSEDSGNADTITVTQQTQMTLFLAYLRPKPYRLTQPQNCLVNL